MTKVNMPWNGINNVDVPVPAPQEFFVTPDVTYGPADKVPSMTYSQDDPAFAGNSPGRMVGVQPSGTQPGTKPK